MKKWLAVCSITAVIAVSISACSSQGTKENDAGERGATTFDQLNNEKAEQGMTEMFSSLMSLKLPQGLAIKRDNQIKACVCRSQQESQARDTT